MECKKQELRVGFKAPCFSGDSFFNGEFNRLSLKDFKGKWLVFFFYPLDFTFVCPTEIRAFHAKTKDFNAINCEVLGCSIDSKFSHRQWTMTDLEHGGVG